MEPLIHAGIRIDKDGVWYYRGAEMIRKEIITLFSRNLRQNEAGEYLIELNDERCHVDVEDTPFVVKSVSLVNGAGKDFFSILLTDDNVEELNLDSLRISEANILYCTVKGGAFDARFSRPAHYQLADSMEHDSRNDTYFVAVNGHTYYIRALRARPH